MANTKVTSHVIANNAISASMIQSAAVTDAKLHATLDLSGKTLTLPATAIPSASTATTQLASDNSTKIATTAYVTTAIGNLVDSAPGALNTLNELAAALGDDASFSSTVTTQLATKLPLAGGTLTGALTLSGAPTNTLHATTKTYVDTADALKLNLSGGTLTGDLTINTTGALQIPAGTTGQRPSAATAQIRWNTTDGALEVYNGSAWTAVGTGSSNKVLDTFTGDGSNATFTLSVTPANEDAIMVFIDGAYQEKSDYTLTNNSLVLDSAPALNEKIAVHTTTASVHDGTTAVNQQFTATAGQTAFTLSQDPKSENNTQVYINGVYQQKTDYTVVGTTLTFDTGVSVGDIVEVNMFTVATLGNTDTITEGVSNQYFTNARARGAISVSGNAISYNSSTGVLTANFEEGPVFTGNVQVSGSLGIGSSASFPLHINASTTDVAKFQTSGSYTYTRFQNSSKTWALSVGNDFSFYDEAASATRMVIDSSGNVGIGKTNPGQKLEVGGTVFSNSTNELAYTWQRTGIGKHWSLGSDANGTYFYNITDGVLPIFIKNAGNVGIGKTNPSENLHISSDASGDHTRVHITKESTAGTAGVSMRSKDASNTWTIFSEDASASDLYFYDGADYVMTLDSANNRVGVGTTSPGRLLTLFNNDQPVFQITNNTSGTASTRGLIQYIASGSTTAVIDNQGSGSGGEFSFMQAGNEAMKIKSNGHVGVNIDPYAQFAVYRNQTDPYTVGSFLDYPTMELKHPATTGGYNGVRYTNTSGNYEWFAGTNQNASNAADFVFQGYDRGGGTYREMARIHDSGSITAPNQVGFRARGTRTAWIQGNTTVWNVLTSANTGNAFAGVYPIGLSVTGDNHMNGYNIGSCFNVSNGRFTAPIEGKYQVYGSAYCGKNATNATSYMHFLVYVNGQQINEIYTIGGNNHNFAHDFSLNFSTVLFLEVSDYVDWRIYTYDANVQVYGNHCSIGAHLLS